MASSQEITLHMLGGCPRMPIFPLALAVLWEVQGVDHLGLLEQHVVEPLSGNVPPAYLHQFRTDMGVSGVCGALVELASTRLPAKSYDAVLRAAQGYLQVVEPSWAEARQLLSADENPRVQEKLQAIREYHGVDVTRSEQRSSRPLPGAADDDAERRRFAETPLRVPPRPDLTAMLDSLRERSESGAASGPRRYRGTVPTAVEYIGSYWMFERPPSSHDLPFVLAADLDALGLDALGTLGLTVTDELMALRRAGSFGDVTEWVPCTVCARGVSSLDATAVRRAIAAGAWVCDQHGDAPSS